MYKPIAESNNFIVLDQFHKHELPHESSIIYQTEENLEREFILDLVNLGYEHISELTTSSAMFSNARLQLQHLNDVQFTDSEWERFKLEYLDKPGENLVDKTRKIQDDY